MIAEEVKPGTTAVGTIAFNTTHHAEAIAAWDRKGLDTVRCDHTSGRVNVVSREYDNPQALEAAQRAQGERDT